MLPESMQRVIDKCAFPGYTLTVKVDGRGAIFLQGYYDEKDVDTGIKERQYTRRWFLSPEMSDSEIVQTAFKLVLTSHEHRVREWFTYRGRQVFGPHFDVNELWEAAGKKKDKRPRPVPYVAKKTRVKT